jgi:hypothetical protein
MMHPDAEVCGQCVERHSRRYEGGYPKRKRSDYTRKVA